MADLTEGQRALMGAGIPMLEAAAQHLDTAAMWDTYRGAYATAGLEVPATVTIQDMNWFRGYASQAINAAEALNRAPTETAFTHDFIAPAPGFVPTAGGEVTAQYLARHMVTIETPEGVLNTWMTARYSALDLPATVGGLTDDLMSSAQDNVDGYVGQDGTSTGGLEGTVTGVSLAFVVQVA